MNYLNKTSHRVSLELNCAGFKGADLDTAMPHFVADRKTELTLTWASTAEGPESFRLVIEVAAAIAAGGALKSFVQELSKDLYQWSKEGLTSLFSEKDQSNGSTTVVFDDVTLVCRTEGGERLERFFRELPELLEETDSGESEVWQAIYDGEEQTWHVEPS